MLQSGNPNLAYRGDLMAPQPCKSSVETRYCPVCFPSWSCRHFSDQDARSLASVGVTVPVRSRYPVPRDLNIARGRSRAWPWRCLGTPDRSVAPADGCSSSGVSATSSRTGWPGSAGRCAWGTVSIRPRGSARSCPRSSCSASRAIRLPAKIEGASVLCGGTWLTGGDLARGYFVAPHGIFRRERFDADRATHAIHRSPS